MVSIDSRFDRFRDQSKRTVALCYHSIHADKPFATASPEMFERHLAWLTEHCDVGEMSEECVEEAARMRTSGDEKAVRPSVLLTFDDGYDDNFEFVFPTLIKYGVRATFFITTGFVEQDPTTLARFKKERGCSAHMLKALDWGQIEEMQAAGMVFGAHSHTHRNLAGLDDAQALTELKTSKAILEEKLGQPIKLMAYPYGKPRVHFTNDRTVPLVRSCGYSLGAAVLHRAIRPSDSVMAVPRFFVARDDVAALSDKVKGRADAIGRWQEHAPILLQRVVSPSDFAH